MLRQGFQQKLLQKLSPQQIQFIKLLQVPTAMLDARIKEELEENPALEDGSLMVADDLVPEYEYDEDQISKNDDDSVGEFDSEVEFNIDDYIQDDEPDYRYHTDSDPDEEDKKDIPVSLSASFHEQLSNQLNLLVLDDKEYLIAQQIIGSIDEDGYLRRPISSLLDDLAFSQNISASEEETEYLISLIQEFDPQGVCARDIRECLLLQLKKKDQKQKSIQIATRIVDVYLDEFTRKHYDKLEKILDVPSEVLRDAINEILKLNPKPGGSVSDYSNELQIIPDFVIRNSEGVLTLTLNSRNAPELKVSRSYQDMFREYDQSATKDKKMRETVQFVKQKLDSAKWFISSIKQRQQTLIKTMNAIMHYQYEYFLEGDDRKLKPMILKDIASRINMDISTVSRVANSKYVQTDFGTFLLKTFFSEGMQTDSGEEVSTREVKVILEQAIAAEDKKNPISDEKLSEILQDKGYNIARRTVAKYREQLGISVARLRKEL